jgi:hypothetical protein
MSDETPSSEEEVSPSMCSTRPPSRTSVRSKQFEQHPRSFVRPLETSSGMSTPVSRRPNSGELFHFIPQSPNHAFGLHGRQVVDPHILESQSYPPLQVSNLADHIMTPRQEYLSPPAMGSTFPIHAPPMVSGAWLSPPTVGNHGLNSYPFPETYEMSPLHCNSITQQYPPPQASRRTTIVLDDIEETTLSKVMSILIQEKARVKMETTPSDRSAEQR